MAKKGERYFRRWLSEQTTSVNDSSFFFIKRAAEQLLSPIYHSQPNNNTSNYSYVSRE